MKFDRKNIKDLRIQIQDLLDNAFDGSEVDIKVENISFSPSEATIKLSAFAEGAEEAAKAEWDMYCHRFDMSPSDFGREFTSRGTRYKIVGLKTGRPKFPIMAERMSDNASYKMPASMVVRGLNAEGAASSAPTTSDPAPMPKPHAPAPEESIPEKPPSPFAGIEGAGSF